MVNFIKNIGIGVLCFYMISCLVDYSILEERYCSNSGECIAGYVCDPDTKKCVREIILKDYGVIVDSYDIGPSEWDIGDIDIHRDTEELFDGFVVVESGDSGYFDFLLGEEDTYYEDVGCLNNCDVLNQTVCISPVEYKICVEKDGCLVWETGKSCGEKQYCDEQENICKDHICKPFEKGCDKQVAYLCNKFGSGFDYAVDCNMVNKVCLEGECVDCRPDCSNKCKGENDGCGGECPDPCNANGNCTEGVCTCNVGFEGPYCDKCSDGYTGYPNCVKCGGDKEICCESGVCSKWSLICTYGVCRTKCPDGMVRVDNSDICIDAYEASKDGNKAASIKGANPWVNLTRDEAQSACNAAGKRLCSIAEWSYACKGPNNYLYPYGNSYEPKRCVDLNAQDVCNNGDGSGVMPTGSRTFCEGGYPGIFDMSGNVWEWVLDKDGNNCKLMGGSVDCCNRGNDKPACLSCNSIGTQRCDLKWPALGFRCCKEVP